MKAYVFFVILFSSLSLCCIAYTQQCDLRLNERVISKIESSENWQGLSKIGLGGKAVTLCGELLVPGEVTYTYKQAQSWLGWDEIQLDVGKPDSRTLKMMVKVRAQSGCELTAETELHSFGWRRLSIPLVNFEPKRDSNYWKNVKEVTVVASYLESRPSVVEELPWSSAINAYSVVQGHDPVRLANLKLVSSSDIQVKCDARSKPCFAGQAVEYPVILINNTDKRSDFELSLRSVASDVFTTDIEPPLISLEPREHGNCVLRVRVPEGIPVGGKETQKLIIIPDSNRKLSKELDFITVCGRPHPYIRVTREQAEAARRKIEKYTWARDAFNQVSSKADTWSVPQNPWKSKPEKLFDVDSVVDAWLITGDISYRDKLIEYLRRLSDPEKSRHLFPALDYGVHLGIVFVGIAEAYDAVFSESVLTDDDHRNIRSTLRYFLIKADEYLKNGAITNYYAAMSAAGICSSLVLGDMVQLDRFIYGQGGFADQIAWGVMGDGWWWEGATHYQWLVMNLYSRAAQPCKNYGIDLWNARFPAVFNRTVPTQGGFKNGYLGMSSDTWGDFGLPTRGLKDMYDGFIPLMDCKGVVVANNDSSPCPVDGLYDQAYSHYRDPVYLGVIDRQGGRKGIEALLWGLEELPGGTELPYVSAYRDNVGLVALRSQTAGREAEEQIEAVLKYGSHGGWHGHFDRISLLSLSRYGKHFYHPRVSWYGYKTLHKEWVQSSASHNMVIVDGLQQEPVASENLLFHSGKMMQACVAQTQARWCETPQWSYIWKEPSEMAVEYDPNFTPVLQRRLLIVTDDYVVIADYMSSDQNHTYDWLIHPAGFKSMDTPLQSVIRHEERLGLQGAFRHITDCNWYEVQSPFVSRFEDGVLKMNIHCLWPSNPEVVLATYPASQGTGTVRRTLGIRVEGKQARYLTVIEPWKDKPVVKRVLAESPDSLSVELTDARIQTINIEGFEGDGSDILITISEFEGGKLLRNEVATTGVGATPRGCPGIGCYW